MSPAAIVVPPHAPVRQRSSSPSPQAAFQHVITLTATTPAAKRQSQRERRIYKCRHCDTSFRRSEHCVRHERSHTLEKPFSCSICACQFSRKDLVVRHERTVHAETARPEKRRRKESVCSSAASPPALGAELELDLELSVPSPASSRASLVEDPLAFDEKIFTPPPSEENHHPSAGLDFDTADLDEVLGFLPDVDISTPSPSLASTASLEIHDVFSTLDFNLPALADPSPTPGDLSAFRSHLVSDLASSFPPDLLDAFRLPSAATLQLYIDSYFTSFHKHFPLLHRPTFTSAPQKACLVLAVCTIGAQYCLEKRRAKYLYEWTKRFAVIEEVRWRREGVEERGWLVMARLLLAFWGMWSGEEEAVTDCLNEQSWFAGYFRRAQKHLADADMVVESNWELWRRQEGLKRLCYGIFILQSFLSITFTDVPPTLPPSTITLPLPSPEDQWESATSDAWSTSSFTVFTTPSPRFTLTSPLTTTGLSAIVQIHGHLCTQHFHATSTIPLPPLPPLPYTHSTTTTPFNAAALLRLAHIRHTTSSTPPPRSSPLTAAISSSSLQSYITQPLQRSAATTASASLAAQVLTMPIRAGVGIVMRTAPLRWGLEHVVAGWEGIVFLLRWLWTMEGTPRGLWEAAEEAVFARVVELLRETDLVADVEGGRVAGRVAGLWGGLLGVPDCWVWGFTRVLGEGLRDVAVRLEEESEAAREEGVEWLV